VHLINSPYISLHNHLFSLQVRIQAAFQALYLAQEPTVTFSYHKLSHLFPLPFKSSFLLRPRKLALRAGVSRSRVPQLSPLLL
jgi:hypothetical protein